MDSNSRSLLILIHGWGGDVLSFYPGITEFLESQGYKVVAPKLPNSSNQDFKESFEVVEKIIKDNSLLKINIIAHSSGGYLACKIAEKYPINNMLLIAPASPTNTWSENRMSNVKGWLRDERLKAYLDYHLEDIDILKVEENINSLEFVFGLKDPYIDETNREFYTNGFKKINKLYIFEDVGHMTGEEWPVKYAVENLFK